MESATDELPKEKSESQLNNYSDEKSPSPSISLDGTKNPKKDERNKKEEKNVELLMKSLNSIPTIDEKLSTVCKKYVQCLDENKRLQFYIKQSDKRYNLLLKEKEQLQQEFNKAILLKSKLENLCRELQKQNKAIKEESLHKIREEEERRKETQAKFQNTLSEITAMLQQNNEKNAKLRDDNISMSEKFKSVVQQYQLREQQVDKLSKQMALETQLSDAKMQKANLEHQADKERLLAEMEQLKLLLAQHKAKMIEMQNQETSLKGQLAIYTDKYDEFQNALVKSNQVFGGFKDQMEMMSKKIKKLEKESLSWKSRWEKSQSALLEMCSERQASDERASSAARQLHHLQGLCRTLQSERTLLVNTLKEHNIERPPLPALPPPAAAPAPLAAPPAPLAAPPVPPTAPPVPPTALTEKVEMAAQLRASLAHLQSELNTLTSKNEEKPEPPKPEKTKKSKSKKNKEKQQNQQEKSAKVGNADVVKPIEELKVSDIPAVETTNSSTSVQESAESNKLVVDSMDTNLPIVETTGHTDTENVQKNEATENKTIEVTTAEEKPADPIAETVENKTIESLIQAINEANINLCDLEVGDDDIEMVQNGTVSEQIKLEVTQNGDDSVILETNHNDEPVNIEVKSIPKVES